MVKPDDDKSCALCSELGADLSVIPDGPCTHVKCLEKCPRVVRENELKWWNVKQTVEQAADAICTKCSSLGAAVLCAECEASFHVKCTEAEVAFIFFLCCK